MPWTEYLIVAGIAAISGGYAIPAGFLLELHPIETYLAAAIGSTVWLLILIPILTKARSGVLANRRISDKATAKMESMHERWGVKGIGLFGPIFPGVTVAAILGIALGLDGKELAKWMSTGAALLYLVYTLGIWLLFAIWG